MLRSGLKPTTCRLQDGPADFNFQAKLYCTTFLMAYLFLLFQFRGKYRFLPNKSFFTSTTEGSFRPHVFHKWSTLLTKNIGRPWSSLIEGDENCIGPSDKLLCFMTNHQNYAAFAWFHSIHCANPIVHLLLLKDSMGKPYCKIDNLLDPPPLYEYFSQIV